MQRLIEEKEDGNEILVIEAKHSNGEYYISVNKHTVEGNWTTWKPMDEGNFRFTLIEGRKSKKKLEKMNSVINEIGNNLLDLWLKKEYRTMIAGIKLELAEKGII